MSSLLSRQNGAASHRPAHREQTIMLAAVLGFIAELVSSSSSGTGTVRWLQSISRLLLPAAWETEHQGWHLLSQTISLCSSDKHSLLFEDPCWIQIDLLYGLGGDAICFQNSRPSSVLQELKDLEKLVPAHSTCCSLHLCRSVCFVLGFFI